MDDDQSRELGALEVILTDSSAEPIKISYGLLKYITRNFSNEIGRGGFGVVYKGDLQNGVVAVKKIKNLHKVSDKQFMDEIKCLQGANHKNVVRFLGYCSETVEEMLPLDGTFFMAGEPNRLLCFEYVSNGNIGEYLDKEKPDGSHQWHMCYKLIKGVCQGLHYLHEKRITHLDLKPENVMLDDCMEPKLTDLGASRFLDGGISIMVTENIRGTLGYIAPEMITRGHISFKSDIYALGIIMIKLLTGRNIIDFDNWQESIDQDRPGVSSCIEIARNCIEFDQDQRPTISNIILELDKIERIIQEMTSGTTGSSTEQITCMMFPGTDLLDVYPRKLNFPFQPNKPKQEMQCQLSLINKTDCEVGFFVLPPNLGDRIMIRSLNGILTARSTSVLTLKMSMIKEDNEPPLDMEGVLILMFTMSCSDDVRELMKTLVNEEGEMNMSTDDLYEQVKTLGGEIHRAMLTAVIISSEDATRTPTFVGTKYMTDYLFKSAEVHPTKPWILVASESDVSIWNWQTMETMHIKKKNRGPGGNKDSGRIRSAKFIARKHWVILSVGKNQGNCNIQVYSCRTWKEPFQVQKIEVEDTYTFQVYPTRPFVLLRRGYDGQVVNLLDWDQNWSTIYPDCAALVGILRHPCDVVQVVFNTRDANNFATLGNDKRVKIWKSDWSQPIATLEGLERVSILENIFTCKADQHLVAAISGRIAHIWDLQNRKHVHTLSALHGGPSSHDKIVGVACHRTRPVLVTASNHGYIHVWDSTTYRLKKEYVNLGRRTFDIAFVDTKRLMIRYEGGIEVMEIDL